MGQSGEDVEAAVPKGGKPVGLLMLAVAALVVCLPFSSFFLLDLRGRFEEWRNRRRFDAATWRSQSASDRSAPWPPRLCMVDDLLAGGRLTGMTKDQVVQLLGTPEPEDFPLALVNVTCITIWVPSVDS